MESQTKTQSSTMFDISPSIMNLPILKHFDKNEISSNISSNVDSFKKGEKGIFQFLKLVIFGGAIYAFAKYALPQIFILVGQMIGMVLSGAVLVFALLMLPTFIKWIRALAKTAQKVLVKNDPFGQFEKERVKMTENLDTVRLTKNKIRNLQLDMQADSQKSEKDADNMQKSILKFQTKATGLKTVLDDMIKKQGPAAKESDDYVNGNSDFLKTVSEADRIKNQLDQAKDLVEKYGSRSVVMKRVAQKLTMAETSIEIKISDFDATVDMLKKDFEFGRKSNEATSAAKSALGFTQSWELGYAMDVVQSTISNDIAITAGNLKDIDSLTSKYALDSDELYSNLNSLADSIKTGKDEVPVAKKYNNPDYKLTSNDKIKSGGMANIFEN